MGFLINPNFAYLLIVTAVMLLLLTICNPKSNLPKIGMALCLVVVGYEFVYLKGNPWAFLVVAFSPLPFFIAIRQTPVHLPLLGVTILMLTIGSFFLLVDQNGHPIVNYGLAGLVSALCGSFIWIGAGRMRNAEGARLSNDPDSVVGLIGEARTDIEAHTAGSVLVEGELWQARSKEPIPAGSTVRILREDGFVLTVIKADKLTKE
jgi:membrane-bound serine protease (ClpP class)